MMRSGLIGAPHKSQIPSLLQSTSNSRPLAGNTVDGLCVMIIGTSLTEESPSILTQDLVQQVNVRRVSKDQRSLMKTFITNPDQKPLIQPVASESSCRRDTAPLSQFDALSSLSSDSISMAT